MLVTIVTFIILISVLILTHEIGHFVMAKYNGVRVEEFGVGLPPRLFGVRVGETIYSLNLLPIGGFVRLTGEEPEVSNKNLRESAAVYSKKKMVEERETLLEVSAEQRIVESGVGKVNVEEKKTKFFKFKKWMFVPRTQFSMIHSPLDPKSFSNRTNLVKASILFSGVLMNFILGVILVCVVFAFQGVPEIKSVVEIKEIVSNTPAWQAGFEIGDMIIGYKKVREEVYKEIKGSEAFIGFIKQNLGKEVKFLIQRVVDSSEISRQDLNQTGTKEKEITVLLRENFVENEGALGVEFILVPQVSYKKIGFYQIPFQAISESARLATLMFSNIARIFIDIVSKKILPKDVAGPVGIARITGEVAQEGFFQILQFAALLSINLGVVNILPFPGLDGGRLLFVLTEGVTRRKVHPKVEHWVHTVGIAALLLLMLVITFYDIVRIF